MMSRRDRIAIGIAAAFAVAMPMVLLPPGPAPRPVPAAPPPPPLAPGPQPPLATAFARPLFGAPVGEASEELPADAPSLVGIVGRLDQDAVALVRAADGTSRTLAIGESVDGWRLESLAIDAAFFIRGSERVRVPLPAG